MDNSTTLILVGIGGIGIWYFFFRNGSINDYFYERNTPEGKFLIKCMNIDGGMWEDDGWVYCFNYADNGASWKFNKKTKEEKSVPQLEGKWREFIQNCMYYKAKIDDKGSKVFCNYHDTENGQLLYKSSIEKDTGKIDYIQDAPYGWEKAESTWNKEDKDYIAKYLEVTSSFQRYNEFVGKCKDNGGTLLLHKQYTPTDSNWVHCKKGDDLFASGIGSFYLDKGYPLEKLRS